MKNAQSSVIDFLCVFAYKAAVDYMYSNIQVPLFAYRGFVNEFSLSRFVLAWMIYITVYFFIKNTKSNTNSLFIHIIYFISITPFISLYQFDNSCSLWMVVVQCLCLVGMNCLLNVSEKFQKNSIQISCVSYKNETLRFFIFIIILGYFVTTVVKFGIPSYQNLLFEEVYNTRINANLSTFQSVIQNMICKIICPLSLLVMFREKKWHIFVFLTLVQIYTYAVTGYKTYLFIPVVLIGLQFFPNLNIKTVILRSLPMAVLGLICYYKLSLSVMMYAVLGNRVFFLPAKIKFAYFDYFYNNDFLFFSQNSISKFLGVESNYDTNVMYLIGREYFDKDNMWTNTGFMADAYANLGIIGMFLICVILVFVLVFLHKQLSFSGSVQRKEIQTLFITYFISLNDGAAISVLFSGGLLFAVFVVCLVDFSDSSKNSKVVVA